jgi:copper resistance protein B
MKALLALWVTVLLAYPAHAQDPHAGHGAETEAQDRHTGHRAEEQVKDPHAGHAAEEAEPARKEAPPAAYSGPRHAADTLFEPADMDRARRGLHHEHGGMTTRGLLVDRLETRLDSGEDGYAWDAQAWYGGDVDRLWIRTEGEGCFGGRTERAELQALWSRAVTPWFDLQAGVRYDFRPQPERGYLVLGLQGLVPYLFEVDAAAFVSDDGDVSARFEAEYDLLITQRLVLRPRAEVELALQEVPELGIGSGISKVEAGLRLRYEFAREFAPYAGLQWERALGDTADFSRAEGRSTNELLVVAGVNFWF